ncbi:hypothetical protein [Sphingopyxis sp. UBA6723]|uniref:hypothetical protein n=1 Tax=Sphingopyxis sp. UBA6723 TaxID=1947538 RepID=UPI0025EBA4CE|nr:hypothetical protein [Sphingopyxis sp. UBA6723]
MLFGFSRTFQFSYPPNSRRGSRAISVGGLSLIQTINIIDVSVFSDRTPIAPFIVFKLAALRHSPKLRPHQVVAQIVATGAQFLYNILGRQGPFRAYAYEAVNQLAIVASAAAADWLPCLI